MAMPAIREDDLHNLPPRDRRYDAPVAEELVLNVFPNGVKTWVHIYPFEGHTRRRTIGVFPEMSLAEALAGLEESRKLVAIDAQDSRRTDQPAPAASPPPPEVIHKRRIPPQAGIMIGATACVAAVAVLALRWMSAPTVEAPVESASPGLSGSATLAAPPAATGLIRRDLASGDPADAALTPGAGEFERSAPVDDGGPDEQPEADVLAEQAPLSEVDASEPATVAGTPVADTATDIRSGIDDTPDDDATVDDLIDAEAADDEVSPSAGAIVARNSAARGSIARLDRWSEWSHLDRIATPSLAIGFEQRPNGVFGTPPRMMAVGEAVTIATPSAATAQLDMQPAGAPDQPVEPMAEDGSLPILSSTGSATVASATVTDDAMPSSDGSAETPDAPQVAGTAAAETTDPALDVATATRAETDEEASASTTVADARDAPAPPEAELTLSRLTDTADADASSDEIGDSLDMEQQETRALYYLTEVRGMTGQTLTHRWERDGALVIERQFDVRGNRWRVYSQQDIESGLSGEWTVSVSTADGTQLDERRFSVTETTAEPATRLADTVASPPETRATASSAETGAAAKADSLVAGPDGSELPVVVLKDPDKAVSETGEGLLPDGAGPVVGQSVEQAADLPQERPGEPIETRQTLAAVATSPETVEAPLAADTTDSPATEAGELAVAPPEPEPPKEYILVGEVVKVRGTLLTMRALDGRGRTAYRVPRDATVLLDGVETRLQDLLPGQVINIKTGAEIRAVGR